MGAIMKKRILVVDDERSIVRLLSLRLRSQNYDVLEAYDGVQCVDVACDKKPDLILLDIKMPNGSGIEAFENLRSKKTTRNIPVIFITAYPKPEVKELVLKMGAAGFVTKPFNGDMLNKRIKSVLSGNYTKISRSAISKEEMKKLVGTRNGLV